MKKKQVLYIAIALIFAVLIMPQIVGAKGNKEVLTCNYEYNESMLTYKVYSDGKIELPFEHNGSYLEYDEAEGVYKYFEYGQPHLDGKTQEQLAFTNLLIQKCTFSELDANGYLIFNCLTSTPTDGYYLTGGKAIPITWINPSETEPTRYYDAEGNEITLNTGKTYIAYVPDDNWDELVIE